MLCRRTVVCQPVMMIAVRKVVEPNMCCIEERRKRSRGIVLSVKNKSAT